MNPEIDCGQIEGGFLMGLGYHLTEKVKYDPTSGEVITDGTWVSQFSWLLLYINKRTLIYREKNKEYLR